MNPIIEFANYLVGYLVAHGMIFLAVLVVYHKARREKYADHRIKKREALKKVAYYMLISLAFGSGAALTLAYFLEVTI